MLTIANARSVGRAYCGHSIHNEWIAVYVVHYDGSHGYQITFNGGVTWQPREELPEG